MAKKSFLFFSSLKTAPTAKIKFLAAPSGLCGVVMSKITWEEGSVVANSFLAPRTSRSRKKPGASINWWWPMVIASVGNMPPWYPLYARSVSEAPWFHRRNKIKIGAECNSIVFPDKKTRIQKGTNCGWPRKKKRRTLLLFSHTGAQK